MIEGLRPYPAYKDSDAPWLGDVPEHWETRRLRNLSRIPIKNGVGETAQAFREDWPRYIRITDISGSRRLKEYGRASLPPEFLDLAPVEQGDLLLAAVGATYGKTYLHSSASVPACFAGYLVRWRPSREVIPEWASYWTESSPYWDQVRSGVIKSTIENFSASRYRGLSLALPPRSEQAAIVRFLEHADRRIHRYTRAKQKLIKLLDEQKQAIINRVVIRGLNPNVRLKPSGLEWLGDIPEHWEVRRNGRLFLQRNQTGFPGLPILEVSLRTGVRVRNFETSDRKQVLTIRENYKRAAAGDIAYNMMRMWQGAVGVAPTDGLVSPAYVVARPLPGTEPRYFATLFRTRAYMGEVDKYSRGIVKDRNRLYWEDFKQMPSCYPPYPEQSAIADAIAEGAGDVDQAIGQVRREIQLMSEYRTRLITEIVTGKLDVCGAAANLPEKTDEPESVVQEAALEEESLDQDVENHAVDVLDEGAP